MTQSTGTWAPPVQREVHVAAERAPPPPYYVEEPLPKSGGGRVCFWLAAACAWAVWGLAVRICLGRCAFRGSTLTALLWLYS